MEAKLTESDVREHDLYEAHENLRRVQLTLDTDYGPQEEAEDALARVIRDLETVMSDHFGIYVEA